MPRLFTDVLGEYAGGRTTAELTEALADLVVACRDTGKKGTITLTIDLTPNDQSTVKMLATVKVKKPEPRRGDVMFFTDAFGNLTRRDPSQRELPFKEVASQPPAQVRDLSGAAQTRPVEAAVG
jgi:hypothetical protein